MRRRKLAGFWLGSILLISCTRTPGDVTTDPGNDGQNGQNGQNGQDGLSSLVRVSTEPAGVNCPLGGSVIETGLDRDRDGVLSDAEVDASSYVCRDSNGNLPDVFTVRIENISSESPLPTFLSPGIWAVHAPGVEPLFTEGEPDRGLGLESLAEDGNPTRIAPALEADPSVGGSGIFNAPLGGGGTGPLFPGQTYEFVVTASPRTPELSFASMFGQSNDVILSNRAAIELFDVNGAPIDAQIATHAVGLFDLGTEANEAPGTGPNQAPRQPAPNTGPGELGVREWTGSTHALPLADRLVHLTVAQQASTYVITVENVSEVEGAFVSPIAPIFWAVHSADFALFAEGEPAVAGLEMLAEDGSPARLAADMDGAPGILASGTQAATVELPSQPGPLLPGARYQIAVTPDAAHRFLTLAGMVGQTNDAFISFPPAGLALLGEDGSPRPAADVERDAQKLLAIWDAGTEMNEAPGVGPNQAPRQSAPNTGAADPTPGVRRYVDTTNDFAPPSLGGAIDVSIRRDAMPRTFQIHIRNTSGGSGFPAVLGPTAWATHGASFALFGIGSSASAGLEKLAEDGSPSILAEALGADATVFSSGVAIQSDAGATGPIHPGEGYTFTVTVDPSAPRISMAAMVVPSNDTFWSFGPQGIALLDDAGNERSDADIAADVAASLRAYDAGTEANQAAAGGRDMAPYQAGPNTGAGEGSGLVRALDDPIWSYPSVEQLVRLSVVHVEQ